MDWVEEGDHLVLSRLTERGGFLLINDICCKSPKAEIKYFCLNVTFVSFAGVEKGICQNPRALAKGGFPLGTGWELLPTFTLMAFTVAVLHLESTLHPFTSSDVFWMWKHRQMWAKAEEVVVGCGFFRREEGRPWFFGGFWRFSWWSRVTVFRPAAPERSSLQLLQRVMLPGPGHRPVPALPQPLAWPGYHYLQCVTSDSLGQALKQSILHNLENQPSLQKQRGNIGNKDGYIIWRQPFFHGELFVVWKVEGQRGGSQGSVRG